MSILSNYVPGFGPFDAKLAIIGIAPSAEEVKQRKPFVGPSGRILAQDCKDAGINLDSCYRTNIFKHQLPNNEFKRYEEMGLNLKEAMADLSIELNDVNPNCILGLGDPVLYSLAGKSGKGNGISVWRGSILSVLGRKAVFTWHPAHELHSEGEEAKQWKSWQRYVRKFDVSRAVKQSESSKFSLPQRLLRIANSSSDLYRFIESNWNEEYCALDIEAIENIPVCIGLSFQPNESLTVPLWGTVQIQCNDESHPKKSYNYSLKVSSLSESEIAYCWKILSEFLLQKQFKFVGQNFKYDEDKLNRLGLFLHGLYWDTMIGTHCISSEMPKSLAFQTSIYTEEPYYKLEGKNFIPGKDKIEDLFHYNGKDACITREILDVQFKELREIPYGLEHALWRMQLHTAYSIIDNTGFKVDEDEREFQIHKYVSKLIEMEKELHDLYRHYNNGEIVNLRSPIQVDKLLYGALKIPRRKGTGEEVVTSLLANVVKSKDQRRICEGILDYRRIDKTLGYLKANNDYDERMKTSFIICGTENYRTSTNTLEPPVRPKKIGWAFQTVTKHGDIGQDLRSILISDIGYVIVNIDQSQAEARVCSLLADDEDTLADYDKIDKHAYTAAKFFGGRMEQYSKKILGYECPERFVGKTLRHAYHLGISKHETMVNINTDARKYKIPITISEYKAGEGLKILERDTPKIQTIFHATIQELLQKERRLFGTFNASRYFYDDYGRDLFKGAYSFIPQQTISDKTKQVILLTQKNLWDVKIVVESHDSLAMMIREKVLDERIEEIQTYFSIPISFERCSIKRRDLIIPTDVEIGYNYCDLKEYKGRKAA